MEIANVEEFGLQTDPMVRRVEDGNQLFGTSLNIGIQGDSELNLPILFSSEGAEYNGQAIRVLYMFPHPQGHLTATKDQSRYGASLFAHMDKGQVVLTHSQVPVHIDGVLGPEQNPAQRNLVLLNEEAVKIGYSKLRTKEIMQAHGVQVPGFFALNPRNGIDNKVRLEEYFDISKANEIVIKGDGGGGGMNVRIFNSTQIDDAVNFALYLSRDHGTKTYAEYRVMPLEWKVKNTAMDWNIRAFITFNESPVWVDGMVRFSPFSGKPVNIAQGARATLLEDVASQVGFDSKDVIEYSLSVGRALAQELKSMGQTPYGFAGIDVMVSKSGQYLLEINIWAVGGLIDIAKLRHAPVSGVKRMLATFGPRLHTNYLSRPSSDEYTLDISSNELATMAGDAAFIGQDYERAVREYLHPNMAEDASALAKLSACYLYLGNGQNAYVSFRQAYKLNPELAEAFMQSTIGALTVKNHPAVEMAQVIYASVTRKLPDLGKVPNYQAVRWDLSEQALAAFGSKFQGLPPVLNHKLL